MKILFFAKNFYTPQFYGGMEKYLYTLVRKLRNRHQISLFIPLQYNYSIKGVKIYHWMFTNIPILDTCTTVLSIALVAPVIFLLERPQIISGFIPSFASTTFFALAKLYGIKTIINFRGTGNKRLKIVQFLESCTFLFCNAIITNAKPLVHEYRQENLLLNWAYKRIPQFYIPNAVDCEFWAPPEKYPMITHDLLYIANLTNRIRIEKKGLAILYEALKLIKEKHNKTLKVMMIGKYRQKSVEWAVGTFETEFFDWVGSISNRTRLRSLMWNCKIFILSSNIEGMPNSLMESMAAGLPVISTDVGAVHDLIEDGTNGIIVPPRNAACLAEKIWKLISDPTMQGIFATNGRKKMVNSFNWDHNLSLVEKTYTNILMKRKFSRH